MCVSWQFDLVINIHFEYVMCAQSEKQVDSKAFW